MTEGLRLWLKLAGAAIRGQMQYRMAFLVATGWELLGTAVDLVWLAALLHRFPALAGWSPFEVGLLYGLAHMELGVYRALGSELHSFERYIIRGEFDGLMVRPWPTLLMVLGRGADLTRLGRSLQGLAVFAVCAAALIRSGGLTAVEAAYLLAVATATGAGIFFSLSLATSAAAFWVSRVDELQVVTMHAPHHASLFPLDIFNRWLRWFLTAVVPVAFATYVPTRYVLGKGGAAPDLLLAPAVAAAAVAAAYRLWRVGERHYQSAGS